MTRYRFGQTARLGFVVLALVGGSSFQPPIGRAQTAVPVTRPCDPPYFGLTFSDGRGAPGDTADNDGTIARLREQAARDPGPLPVLDLARCYYVTHQLERSAGALNQALARLDAIQPVTDAIPETWSRLPLAGRDVPRPVKQRDKPPAFRPEAVDLGIRGVVFVDAVIDREGRVRAPRIARTVAAHDWAALDAVSEWQYAPTLVNGQPVEIAITLLVSFGISEIRPVDAIDAATFFATRGHADARGWATRAAELVTTEGNAWASALQAPAVKGPITEPRKIHNVPPIYPATAKAARVQGLVVIEALIGADGTIPYARVRQGHPFLQDAALRAVRQWRYEPARVNGQAIAIRMTMTSNFTLK